MTAAYNLQVFKKYISFMGGYDKTTNVHAHARAAHVQIAIIVCSATLLNSTVPKFIKGYLA